MLPSIASLPNSLLGIRRGIGFLFKAPPLCLTVYNQRNPLLAIHLRHLSFISSASFGKPPAYLYFFCPPLSHERIKSRGAARTVKDDWTAGARAGQYTA